MTGASMPPIDSDAASLPQLGSGRGVYLTRHTAGSTGGDLWVVGTARHTSTRIASVDGPRIDVLDVLDLSADGAWAILRVGTFSPSGTNPECADLYLVPTDGSPVTRLTRARAGDFVVGAGFSPGGSRVAYATWDAVFVIDLPSGQTVKLPGCETGYGVQPVRVLWAPDVDRFAILCQHVEIYDPSGRSAPTVVPSVDAQLNAVWADERHLLVALATSGPSQGGLHVDSFDIVARTSTLVGRIKDDGIEWVIPSLGGFSPDGRQLVAEGGEVGVPPGSDFKEVGYLAPTEDGAARVILGERQLQDVAWSADGGSIVYVDITDGSQPTLARLDVRTLERTTLGLLPPTYGGGVWQVP